MNEDLFKLDERQLDFAANILRSRKFSAYNTCQALGVEPYPSNLGICFHSELWAKVSDGRLRLNSYCDGAQTSIFVKSILFRVTFANNIFLS